jgi:hypothetical protein
MIRQIIFGLSVIASLPHISSCAEAGKEDIMSRRLSATSQQEFITKVQQLSNQAQGLLAPSITVNTETTKTAQAAFNDLSTILEIYKNTYTLPKDLEATVKQQLDDLASRFPLVSTIQLAEITEISIPVTPVTETSGTAPKK